MFAAKNEISTQKIIDTDKMQYLTVKQAAGYMNISKEYLYSLARAKKLRHIKIGAKRLFTVQDIEEFIKPRTVEPEEKQEADLVRNVILRAMLGRTNNKLNKR